MAHIQRRNYDAWSVDTQDQSIISNYVSSDFGINSITAKKRGYLNALKISLHNNGSPFPQERTLNLFDIKFNRFSPINSTFIYSLRGNIHYQDIYEGTSLYVPLYIKYAYVDHATIATFFNHVLSDINFSSVLAINIQLIWIE